MSRAKIWISDVAATAAIASPPSFHITPQQYSKFREIAGTNPNRFIQPRDEKPLREFRAAAGIVVAEPFVGTGETAVNKDGTSIAH